MRNPTTEYPLITLSSYRWVWPCERRRWTKAEQEARRMYEIVKEVQERSKDVTDLR